MKIKIPHNLNKEELKCFNEIVSPQLKEIYTYTYDCYQFKHLTILISKDAFPETAQKPNIEDVKIILNQVPDQFLSSISEIYFVSYHCKEDHNKIIKGRTLPLIYTILIYPKSYSQLKIVLFHETGHVFFEKKLSKDLKRQFAILLLKTFSTVKFSSLEGYSHFIKEEFAHCFENYLNNPNRLKKYSLLYEFFITHFK
tara:strand:- start:623 stop:1216 length:594 start_codon:yes stop_codon:yes gene_type:complete